MASTSVRVASTRLWRMSSFCRTLQRRLPSGSPARLTSASVSRAVALPRPARASWYEDAAGYEYALRRQRSDHAPVLVYFRTDWCPHCRALDGLLDSPEVRARLGDYLKVRINPEHGTAERRLFEKEYGSRGYPALFLRADG